ncbi:hypothetical protein GIB67_016417 [Kingdonia uniflora]|uniref:Uncharacterized protein n=1 Tax=Kingdonia uniflora TaxID=39325 RepID=A0A7J7MGW9_9MAGN|nr:hypothetical protein GIB67_016417 [Kingdonia uniflora]
MLPTISVGYLFTNSVHLIWESLHKLLAGLNPDVEYARVHLFDWTPFPTLEEAYSYCLPDQSHRSHMPHIYGIPLENFTIAIRYAYLVPPSVPSQTLHTSSPSLSPLPATIGLLLATNLPLSGIEPSPNASIPVTTDDDSPISHSDANKPITIKKEKRNAENQIDIQIQ